MIPSSADAPSPRRPFPWRLALHWAVGYLPIWLFLAAIVFLVQTVLSYMLHDREDVRNFLKVLDRAPKFFKALIGGDDLMPGNVNGIVAIAYQHPLVLVMLMINAVTLPSGLLTGEAERGTMELLLARPITRGRVYAIVCLLTVLTQAGLVGVLLGATAIWTRVFDYGVQVSLPLFCLVSVNLIALGFCVAGISILASVAFAERHLAIGVVVGYLVLSYLLSFAMIFLPRIKPLRRLTLFNYCVPNQVLRDGTLPWGSLAMLFGVGAACLVAGFIVWRRRDLSAA